MEITVRASSCGKRIRFFKAVSSVSLVLFLMLSSPAGGAVFKENTTVMGTDLELTVVVADRAAADRAFAAARAEMERIEKEMSEWIEDSYVSRINRNAGVKPVHVPDELFKVINAALAISEITGGAFDITWAAMHGLWDFRPGHERIATPGEIRERLALINYKDVEIDPGKKTVYLRRPGMKIGLGAIAKGYAVDKTMKALIDMGIKNAIVKAGGDMRVQGSDEGGKPWEIGIKDPRDRARLIARLPLTNASISTSGDYERFFVRDGVLYHHIMDPKTGYPARGSRSVTILAPDTMTSDALSTAVFVMGPDDGLKLVERLRGIGAIMVDANGKIRYSSAVTGGAPGGAEKRRP